MPKYLNLVHSLVETFGRFDSCWLWFQYVYGIENDIVSLSICLENDHIIKYSHEFLLLSINKRYSVYVSIYLRKH